MLQNYLFSALRNLRKRKWTSLSNILGLAIGIAAGLLCFLHIQYELSYDQFHPNSDRIYRIVTGNMKTGEGWVGVSAPIPPKLAADLPEIADFARLTKIRRGSKVLISHENQHFNEDNFFLADSSIFKLFDLPILEGNKEEILNDLSSMAISQSKARQIFGTESPLGKVLRLNDEHEFQISGVFQDLPSNSHFALDFLVSFQNLEKILPGTSLTDNWGQFNYYAYALLQPEATKDAVEQKIQSIRIKLRNDEEFSLERLALQPLKDIHFQHNRGNLRPAYNFNYIYVYIATAIGVILISLVNFINLNTAGSTKRVKEVGVRKVMGASRLQLIFQFISESFLLTLTAFIIAALLLKEYLIPYVNAMFNSNIEFQLSNLFHLNIGMSLVILISILAGAYIAFFVSSFSPVRALKNNFKIGNKNNTLRNSLLGIQFFISILLVISSILVSRQLNYITNKDLGLNKEQVINIPLYDSFSKEEIQLLKNELKNLAGILAVSASGFQPGQVNWNQTVWWEGQQEEESMYIIGVDADFFYTLDILLVQGDVSFLTESAKEDYTYVLNEAAIRHIGWENALGKKFRAFGPDSEKLISGVVNDFHFQSLHNLVKPCLLVVGLTTPSQMLVKLNTTDLPQIIAAVKNKFSEISPGQSFEFAFMDQEFEMLYQEEQRAKTIVAFFSIISILLALFGLYGLLSFEVNERTKELAIRKILGSSLYQLGLLLSKNFLKIVLIASAAGLPLSWWILHNWLANFSYRIELGVPVFLFSFALLFFIIIATIALKIWELRRTNPVKELRFE